MAEVWPSGDVPYEFPGGDDAKRVAWETAVRLAIAAGTLTLAPEYSDVFDLQGTCPRCGHTMSQVIQFAVIEAKQFRLGGTRRAAQRPLSSILDVVCSCSDHHVGRKDDATGCGWGRGLAISVDRPPAAKA